MNSQADQRPQLARPKGLLSPASALALRVRWRVRSVPPRRILVAAAGLIVGAATWHIVGSAQDARSSWGDRVPVLVAAIDIPSGTELDSTNAVLVPYPVALAPRGAITSLDSGRFANHPLSAGQVIVTGQAGSDRDGLTSMTRAVTLPKPLAAPDIRIGDIVELVAVSARLDRAVVTTIGSGSVSGLNDESITIVVDRLVVSAIFEALGSGSIEFARRPTQG